MGIGESTHEDEDEYETIDDLIAYMESTLRDENFSNFYKSLKRGACFIPLNESDKLQSDYELTKLDSTKYRSKSMEIELVFIYHYIIHGVCYIRFI